MLKNRLSRRKFVKNLSAASLALPLSMAGNTWANAQGLLTTTRLAQNIWLISGAGSNVVVAEAENAVVVIDGGLQEHNNALLQEINSISNGKPITALLNTNWRPEHVGLNYLLGASDTKIIAQENTRLWQGADFYVDWQDRTFEAMPLQAQANQSFYKTESMQIGSETIEYGYLPQAHTDGDIYVYFKQANIMVVSDLLGVNAYPIMDYVTGGWIGGMQDASNTLLSLVNEQTQIIASQGGVQTKADLQAQATMLNLAREQIGDSFRSGWSLEDFKASHPEIALGAQWGEADLFLTQLYRGTWYHVPGRAVTNVV